MPLGIIIALLLLAPFGLLAGTAPAAPLDQACPSVVVTTVQGGGQLQVTVNAGTNTQEL